MDFSSNKKWHMLTYMLTETESPILGGWEIQAAHSGSHCQYLSILTFCAVYQVHRTLISYFGLRYKLAWEQNRKWSCKMFPLWDFRAAVFLGGLSKWLTSYNGPKLWESCFRWLPFPSDCALMKIWVMTLCWRFTNLHLMKYLMKTVATRQKWLNLVLICIRDTICSMKI